MQLVNVKDVMVGSKLAKPIIINGTVLYKVNTPISVPMKKTLEKLGVNEVHVRSIFNQSIDSNRLNMDSMNQMVYTAVRRCDIDDIILCAKSLVNSSFKGSYNAMLGVLFDGDEVTYNHSLNVANLAVTAGVSIGMSIKQLRILAAGSLLHDIGKFKLDSTLISKPGKLTHDEYELVKQHPKLGYDMVKDYDIDPIIKQIILQHHENWDGTGYPYQLHNLQVNRLARLVHIADVYDALCAKRSYKEELPRRVVRQWMLEDSGKKFDPFLLKPFLKCIPMYTVGEEINYCGNIGIVASNKNADDPMIYYAERLYKLSEFESISLRDKFNKEDCYEEV